MACLRGHASLEVSGIKGIMKEQSTYYHSPIGLFRLRSDGENLTAVDFCDGTEVHQDEDDLDWPLSEVKTELDEYFAGVRKHFTVPVRFVGTSFQVRAWEALKDSFRTDRFLPMASPKDRFTPASGWTRQRAKPNSDNCPLPPGYWSKRLAHWLRRRPLAETDFAQLRIDRDDFWSMSNRRAASNAERLIGEVRFAPPTGHQFLSTGGFGSMVGGFIRSS
jgi:6-O-methylguanine DNA methyltransferase, ribonuclease-like domain